MLYLFDIPERPTLFYKERKKDGSGKEDRCGRGAGGEERGETPVWNIKQKNYKLCD